MNCLDTTSGCTDTNESFKVAVSRDGVLSGFAWGQKTGWINFGPFNNNSTSQVQISSAGELGGTDGGAGYAWSQRYGWITFDCDTNACVTTDYVPVAYRASSGGGAVGSRPGGSGTGTEVERSQCSDGIDNDADGLVDYQSDAGCYGIADNTENTVVTPVVPGTPTTPTTPTLPPAGTTDTPFPTEPTTTPSGSTFPGPNTAQPSETVVPNESPEKNTTPAQAPEEKIRAFISIWGIPLILVLLVVIYLIRKYLHHI